MGDEPSPPRDGDTESVASSLHGTYGRGTRIGAYKILGLLGEGGFGIVYQAEQTEPVRRRVALKVIKPGMDSRAVIARFEAERQALALMDHPSVARVFDAGTTEQGRPYFVMEHVPGLPITEHCDRQKATIGQRLELFMQVCEAVQHAHQKGIIHRDIKPKNILVSISDGKAVPKVIDFGVAKAISQPLTEKTLFTEQGQLIGTPVYMSPEQAERTAQDIDTRSDIYSLGAVLYELLTGTLPLDAESFRQAAFDEVLRIIREVEPPKPSTLTQVLRGDLDWIIMKALDKDRSRRYASATDLAADIRRHMSHEPVAAGPPSAAYRLRKFVRRNRGFITAAAIVFVVLVAGIIGTSWGMLEASRQRDAAIAARDAEVEQRQVAEQEQDRADREAAESLRQAGLAAAARDEAEWRTKQVEQVAAFQASVLSEIDTEEMGRVIRDEYRAQVQAGLRRRWVEGDDGEMRKMTEEEIAEGVEAFARAADPANPTDVARQMMDITVLTPAVTAAKEEFEEQPLVQAQLLDTLGTVYASLGQYDLAEPHLRQALDSRRRLLGDDHADVATSLNHLAEVLYGKGDYVAAEPLFCEALALRRKLLGHEHADVAETLNNLAALLLTKGNYAAAEPLFREALALHRKLPGDEHRDVALSLNNFALLLQDMGDYATAEPLLREALALYRKLLGDEHPDVALTLNSLALLLQDMGDYAAAEPLYREALAMGRKLLGDEHPRVALSLNNLASLLYAKDDYTAAEPLFREALALRRKLLGDEHPEVATSLNNLALLLKDKGEYGAAEPLFREALALNRKLLGDEHPEVARNLNNLALLLQAEGDCAAAETLFREALALKRKLLGYEHPDVALSLNNLAVLLRIKGDYAVAEPLFREALAIREKELPPAHVSTIRSQAHLGRTLAKLGRFVEAEELLVAAQASLEQHPDAAAQLARSIPEGLVDLYDAWGKPEQAAEWRARLPPEPETQPATTQPATQPAP